AASHYTGVAHHERRAGVGCGNKVSRPKPADWRRAALPLGPRPLSPALATDRYIFQRQPRLPLDNCIVVLRQVFLRHADNAPTYPIRAIGRSRSKRYLLVALPRHCAFPPPDLCRNGGARWRAGGGRRGFNGRIWKGPGALGPSAFVCSAKRPSHPRCRFKVRILTRRRLTMARAEAYIGPLDAPPPWRDDASAKPLTV